MRPAHLASEEALALFLSRFESGALPKAEWTHGAHVAAAAFYLHRAAGPAQVDPHSYSAACDEVLPLLRQRIQTYNLAAGGANTSTSGYHETLTRFWLHIVADLLRAHSPTSSLVAAQIAVATLGEQRTLHSLYYSGDVVKDSAARLAWREPDLQPLP